ncbi:hypothetical protein Ciccas_004517 [Cichlidogyrus casuarinus]|uniref:Uncharacterized protein n=1 Tax=Cichlidogyrus casuarinus TaxID=1844966 RepID=A0ABD2QB92_9PLAT
MQQRSQPNESDLDNGIFLDDEAQRNSFSSESKIRRSSSASNTSLMADDDQTEMDPPHFKSQSKPIVQPRSKNYSENEVRSINEDDLSESIPPQSLEVTNDPNFFDFGLSDESQSELLHWVNEKLERSYFVFDGLPLHVEHETAFMHRKRLHDEEELLKLNNELDQTKRELDQLKLNMVSSVEQEEAPTLTVVNGDQQEEICLPEEAVELEPVKTDMLVDAQIDDRLGMDRKTVEQLKRPSLYKTDGESTNFSFSSASASSYEKLSIQPSSNERCCSCDRLCTGRYCSGCKYHFCESCADYVSLSNAPSCKSCFHSARFV